MGKIFDYVDKIATEVDVTSDFFIVTNGTEEYNISLNETFNAHLIRTPHLPFNTTNIQDGDTLIYNSSTLRWENGVISGGPSTIGELSDVIITNPSYHQVLMYQSGNWVNRTLDTSHVQELNDLSDVNIESSGYGSGYGYGSDPVDDDVLTYYSGEWTNRTVPRWLSQLGDVGYLGGITDGSLFRFDSSVHKWMDWNGGFTGSFDVNDGKIVHVNNGLITSVDLPS
jgi:hypothetical protein